MYCSINFKTKKALKDAIKNGEKIGLLAVGLQKLVENGRVYLEGPHYPSAHTWYAEALVENGLITKIIS